MSEAEQPKAETSIPLGEEEGSRLEFKAAAALDNPFRIGREIVGMLNSMGGYLWIGLEEDENRAVKIDAVSEPERQRDRLRDFLVDSIEPVPDEVEVAFSIVNAADRDQLLRIDISPDSAKQPYALLKQGARLYVKRVDSRLRTLSRGELAKKFEQGGAEPKSRTGAAIPGDVKTDLLRERDKLRGGDSRLWLAIWPLQKIELDLSGDEWYERLLMQPGLSRNRPEGLNFANPYRPPVRTIETLSQDGLELHVNGRINAERAMSDLERPPAFGGLAKEIHPLMLLEYSASLLRLARVVYRRQVDFSTLDFEDSVLGDLAFLGVKGWTLLPGSPGDLGDLILSLRESKKPAPAEDLDIVAAEPLNFRVEEVIEAPDRCAFRLVRRIYAGFGYPEKYVPREFDRDAGRVSFMPPLHEDEATQGAADDR